MSRKLLGFDSWTEGSHHYERLLPALAEHGATLKLVHLGSWGNDPGRPSQEKIGALEVRDIAFYGSNAIERVLDLERPDAVIFLSTQTFAHRAFLRYCQQRSIPTLLLYHGLLNVLVTDDKIGSAKPNRLAYTKFVVSKLGKVAHYTLPCYIRSLLKTQAKPKDWIRFIYDLIQFATGNWLLTVAPDGKATKCAVYTTADIEHAVRTYGFEIGDVRAVGIPDLARFNLTQGMLCCWRQRPRPELKRIMYIDTGLATFGLVYRDLEAFVEHLIRTSQVLASQGMIMLFKPHPAHNRKYLEQRLEESGVELVSNEDFLPKLLECAACVAEPTSLSLVPALTGMPMLYTNYNELRDLRFGPVLTSYPQGYILHDVSDISDILCKDSEEFDPKALNDWITLNAGPLPPEAMPDRVANVVLDLINQKQELA